MPGNAADVVPCERIPFFHTQNASEVAELLAHVLVYPTMQAFAAATMVVEVLAWCGMDLCGPGGGMVMGLVVCQARSGVGFCPTVDSVFVATISQNEDDD